MLIVYLLLFWVFEGRGFGGVSSYLLRLGVKSLEVNVGDMDLYISFSKPHI